MGVIYDQRPWPSTIKPPLGEQVSDDHPLLPTYGLIVQEGGGTTTKPLRNIGPNGTLTNSPIWTIGNRGQVIEFTGITEHINCGPVENIFTDLETCTLVLGWEKTDGTNRSSSAFSDDNTDGVNAERVQTHLPHSDGTVYFDFGSTGSGRISAAGLDHTTPNIWTFVADVNVREIWQGGVLQASTTSSSTRLNTSDDFFINKRSDLKLGDLALFGFLYVYDGRRLTIDEIQSITRFPFQFFKTRHYWSIPAAVATTRMLLTGVGI